MGKSFTREDGLMIDSSAIAMDSSGKTLKSSFLHISTTLNTATASGSIYTTIVNNANISEGMRIANASYSNPEVLKTAPEYQTSNGQIVFNYNMYLGKSTTVDCDLIYCKEGE